MNWIWIDEAADITPEMWEKLKSFPLTPQDQWWHKGEKGSPAAVAGTGGSNADPVKAEGAAASDRGTIPTIPVN